jgi:gliding motility-associated-like protein
MKTIRFLFCFLSIIILSGLLFGPVFCLSQNVINNGTQMVVTPGAYVVIGQNYINRNDGNSNGIIDLNGTIILGRNWVNEANNNVLSNIGASPMGNVIMNGTIEQYIEGTNPTHFENLIIRNSDKILKVSNCEVNGILTVEAVLKLNSQKLIIDNYSTDAINYVSKYILSETPPQEGYGEIQWNIGDNTNTYQIPFGSGLTNNNDINLALTTRTIGNAGGAISFATYPSLCQNQPLPSGVDALDRSVEYIIDRYWIIDPLYNLTKPDINIKFTYTDKDADINCNGRINKLTLKAIRYSTLKNMWNDMPANGQADPARNMVNATNIAAADFFAPWALVNEEIEYEVFIPNAFTPNGDGNNDNFAPQGMNLELYNFDMYIYNRWGEMLFHTNDLGKPWGGCRSGGSKLCEQGVYTYLIYVFDEYGDKKKYTGHVSLLP